MRNVLAAAAFAMLSPVPARADVRPNGLFTDNAVLQRDGEVPVWGTASPGEAVTVSFRGKDVTAQAGADGKWLVKLPPQTAGGPDDLVIRGKNTVSLNNILVGEVWVCSGQSNMEWSLRQIAERNGPIPAAADEQLRLFRVRKVATPKPRATVPVASTWQSCNPESAENFSAVAYYFGRDLRAALGVPVGLIQTAWGGTPAQAWTSREALGSTPSLRHYNERLQRATERWESGQADDEHEAALAAYRASADKAKAEKKPLPNAPSEPHDPRRSPGSAATLYNGMIAPLVPYGLRGVIWYQGEANGGQGYEYRTLFPTLITDWRTRWGRGDFPFLCVQLAPWGAGNADGPAWAELRDAQRLASKALPNVGMAVITDAGDLTDIHPKQKEPVGARLALLARRIAYGQDLVAEGPSYKAMSVDGDKALITFDSVGAGLEARGGPLTGFTICGDDHTFVPARAEIRGDAVVVHADGIAKPVAVRYGWKNFPVVNLFNKDGLPASPFRTDDFPLQSQPKN
jgi:sialate O-acetylesterase